MVEDLSVWVLHTWANYLHVYLPEYIGTYAVGRIFAEWNVWTEMDPGICSAMGNCLNLFFLLLRR
jgi:hypothetical protein